MKSIANIISLTRIFFALALVFTKPLSIMFFVFFLACEISDALDGYIARKTRTVSKLGDNIDSVADLIMCTVLMGVLYSVINPTIAILVWILCIAIVRIISMIIVFVKYRTLEMLHTYGNKITGFMIFVFTLSLAFVQTNLFIYIICSIASLSAIEELLINLFSVELQLNKKSIFL